jgi:hypothetical protein
MSQAGGCSSGMGVGAKSLRHCFAVQRAYFFDLLRRALSVEISARRTSVCRASRGTVQIGSRCRTKALGRRVFGRQQHPLRR